MKYGVKEFCLKGHSIVLRSAEAHDCSMVNKLKENIYSETRFLALYPDEIEELNSTMQCILNFIDEPRGCFILAFVDENIAGYTYLKCSRSYRTARHRASMGIGILEKYTNIGLGQLLIKNIFNLAEMLDYNMICLHVHASNLRARHVYEKMGFFQYGRLSDALCFDDGTKDDIISMVKYLEY